MIAIAVGTASLIIILSVFNGFEGLVKSLYGDFYADLRVEPIKGKLIRFDSAQIHQFKNIGNIADYSLMVEEKAVLKNGDYQNIVFLKGVDDHYADVVNIKHHLVEGSYLLGSTDAPDIILGYGIQNALQSSFKSPVPLTIYMPNAESENFSDLQSAMVSFEMGQTGAFRVQEEFDNKYAFTNLGFVKYMLNISDSEYSALEIKVKNAAQLEKTQRDLKKLFGNRYAVKTRFQQNTGLFTIMQMEKWIIYAILSIILLIAAFNMIGALTMLVLEKKKDIAILKALGADKRLIQNIFLKEGILLGVVGGVIGMLLALTICLLQQQFHLVKLGGTSFLIDYYPIVLSVGDFILVGATVLFVAVLASWIPAKKASEQDFSLKS